MNKCRWGIIGPGRIAVNYAQGLAESDSGELVAIASRSAERLREFGDRFGIAEGKRHGSYEAICADPEIDAIHVATPHPFHAEQALMAIRAGKHVSCQKPLALNEAEATAIVEAAGQEGVFFCEAFMYLHHPQIARLVEIIRGGTLGAVQHIRASFGFAASFDPESRLYKYALAGGGILDVGGYPVSAARMIAGIAEGKFAEPVAVKGTGHLGQTGVDEVAYGLLKFENGITAEIACAVARPLGEGIEIICENGRIQLDNPWVPGRNAGPSDATIRIIRDGTEETVEVTDKRILFAFEAEAASRAILDGASGPDFPAMSPAASIGNARVLDAWRRELGYVTFAERPETLRRLPGVLPEGLPKIPEVTLPGLDRPVTKLIMGCDNRETFAEGAILWDAWAEAGGTGFDTAHHYGRGLQETLLGQWMKSRGMADKVTVIVKGAHSPYHVPDAVGVELPVSLGRLGLDKAAIYILHRDNPDVPVGEFVDAVARERDAGRIGIWGVSNWTVDRFAEAVAYAEAGGLEPPRILNNNLSLAVMERPVWPGVASSNSQDALAYLRRTNTAHVSWSSQARGYFLPAALRDRLPEDSRPEACFGSPDNETRRARATELAEKYGVTPHNIATAWVLAQSFPSLALIGPRSPDEIVSTLPALTVSMTAEEIAWLNLESGTG